MPSGDEIYHAKDAINLGLKGAMVTGGAGIVIAAIQNSLRKSNVGALGAFTRSGGTIATFTAVGGAFEFTKAAAANLRQKDDHYNSAMGGFLAGAIMALRTARMPRILGYGAFTAVVLATYDFTGNSLRGYSRDPEVDEYERKEYLRKNRRRPIEETVAELGEGRGGAIHPPGYEERRRERIKEKYGIEINPVSAKAES